VLQVFSVVIELEASSLVAFFLSDIV